MKTRSERKTFKYQPRGKDATRKRAAQSGGMWDSIFGSAFTVLTLKEDDYTLRACPPTWDDPEHFALDVYVHYNVGPDNQKYLCLHRMKNEPCPVCEEKKELEKAGDVEEAKKLSPSKLVVGWWINREEQESGPMLWGCPWTIDRDIANLSFDKRSGSVICIDDPEQGYDISFSRVGKGLKTKYSGLQIARRPSPLCDDSDTVEEWLAFIQKNPVPDCLNFFDYEYIAGVFSAQPKDDEDEDDEDDRPARHTKPTKAKRRVEEDDDEDEDDEDDRPARRPVKAKVKRRVEEDEDDEEDDRPAPKKKPLRTRQTTMLRDGDEEDEDENPTRGRKIGKKTTARSSRDDDEDEDDDVESPYEEDRPARRSVRDRIKDSFR